MQDAGNTTTEALPRSVMETAANTHLLRRSTDRVVRSEGPVRIAAFTCRPTGHQTVTQVGQAMTDQRTCSRPKCGKTTRARGLCKAHYQSWRNQNPTIPAQHVANHLDQLTQAGISIERLCAITGMQRRQLIRFRRQKFTTKEVANRVLTVPLPEAWWKTAPDTASVPATGTTRRLQALAAIGYTVPELCRASGYKRRQLTTVTHGQTSSVLAASARRVDEAFRAMQLTPPPPSAESRRAITRAKKHGWAVPMAWDEEDIDNPDAKPYGLEPQAPQPFLEKYTEMRALGLSDIEVARRTGATYTAIVRRLDRNQLPVSTELRALTRNRAS